MADEIAGVGIRVDTDGITGGIKALDALADQGPKVEKSLQGVEASAAKTGKSISSLGQGSAEAGLAKVGKAGRDAAADVGKLGDSAAKTAASVKQIDKSGADTARAITGVGNAVRSLVTSNEAVVASIRGLTSAESAHIAKLKEEAQQLRATIAERDKYAAQAAGMLAASKDIAAGIGAQIASLKQVQGASAGAGGSMLALTKIGIGAFLGSQVARAAKDATLALYEASAAAERLRTMLNFATGGNGAQEIEYLRQVTGRLGLEFASASRAYGQFQAAARGTTLEGQKARDVFESIAKASAVMGLSTEQTSGVLLALQQMISKGTVQAEELRGQLGERLPGAFQIAARAMGVTTAELGKMLEQGQVIADDFLPRFARALTNELGGAADGAAERLDASSNKVVNAWERMKQNLGETGFSKFMSGQFAILADGMDGVSEAMEIARLKGSGFFGQMASGAGALAQFINPLQAFSYSAIETGNALKQAEAEYARLKAQGADRSESFWVRNELYNLGEYIKKLKEAKAERDRLTEKPAAYSPARDSQAASEAEARRLDGIRAAMEKVQMSLSGVKDSFYRDLNALYAGYKDGLITLSDYQQQVAKLIEQSGGGKNSASAIKAVNKELEDQQKLMLELSGLNGSFTEEWDRLAALYRRGAITIEQLEQAQAKLLARQPAIAASIKAEEAAWLAAGRAEAEAIAQRDKTIDGLRKSGDAVNDQIKKLRDEEQAAMLAAGGNLSLAQAVQQVTIARLQEAKAKATGIGDFEAAAAIEREIAARRELIGLIGSSEARKAAADSAREAATEWQRTADRIEDSLTDALMRGFESGKDFGRNLRDTLVNMFKSLVLRPIIQPIAGALAGGATALVGGLLGGLGAPGLANAATGGGLVGNALGLGGLLSYGGLGYAGGAAGATAAGLLGFGELSTLGLGEALSGGWAALTGGNIAGGLGTLAGAALPILGGAALIGNAFGLFRSNRTVGAGITGQLGGTIEDFVVNRRGGSLFSGPSYSTPTTGVSSFNADIQRTFDALRQQAGEFAEALGLSGDAARRFTTLIGSDKLSDDTGGRGIRLEGLSADEAARKIQEALTAANEELARSILGSSADAFKKQGETASQTLERLAGSIKGVNGVLDALGQSMLATSLAGAASASQLLDAFGGLQQYQGLATSFLQNFYSEAERAQLASQTLTAQLGAFGLAVPASRDAYRELVEAQDLNTESGRKAYAALLQLAPTFADLVPAIEAVGGAADQTAAQAAEAAARMAEAGRRALEELMQDRGGLEVDLLRAQGNTAGADARQRQIDIAALTAGLSGTDAAAATAAYDYNAALREQIAALNSAAEAQRQVAAERQNLDRQILQLTGDTAAIRAAELAALDPSNRALQERIYALQDEAAESQRLAAVAAQGDSLQSRIDQLLGDTAALRERELAAIDPANRGLQLMIWGLEDAAAAADQASRAQAEAAQQAQAIAAERAGIERQILQLTGDTGSIRALELAGLDESNRALMERVFALQDAAAAEAEAARVAAEAAQQAQAIASQRAGLEQQILQLTGDTSALRALELAGLDASNRSLQERIYVLQDAAAVEAEAARLAAEAEQRAQAIASERSGLERQILQLMGDTAALRSLELAGLDESNRALMERIYALQDAAEAEAEAARVAAEAAQAAERIASERTGLEARLLQAQGDTAALRARELAALDPSNRALLQQIYALEDQQAAAAEAAAALERFTGVMTQLGDTRFDLENQLLGLQGKDAEVRRRTRERELARLVEGKTPEQAAAIEAAYDYNQSLRDQIAAQEAANTAAQEAAQAAEQLRQSWASTAQSLADEARSIRQQIAGDGGAESLAQAQARFAIGTAQALAGDQSAASGLPGLAQAMLRLAEGQVGSFAELQILRARTAASLDSTGQSLSAQFAQAPMTTTDPGVIAELRSLREENQAQSRALAELNLRWVRLVERWEVDGLPIRADA